MESTNIALFNGKNYVAWKTRIMNLLKFKGVVHVLQVPQPTEATAESRRAEAVAEYEITRHLADNMLRFTEQQLNMRELMAKFDSIFLKKCVSTALNLREKLSALKYDGSIPLDELFMKFESIVDEIKIHGDSISKNDQLYMLFRMLPVRFKACIQVIKNLPEESLSIELAMSQLLSEEAEHQATILNEPKVMFADHKSKFNNKKKSHRPKSGKINKSRKCYQCGRPGHIKADCIHYKKMMSRTTNNKNKEAANLLATATTADQHESFVYMLSSSQVNSTDAVQFILDSGATEHIIKDRKLTVGFKRLREPIRINTAKAGDHIMATMRGNLKLISPEGVRGTITDVLFAPELHVNVLSVAKLQSGGNTIIFSPNGVKIVHQDGSEVTGESINNLIRLNFKIDKSGISVNTCSVTVTNNNYKLWHERLGHLSKDKFVEIVRKSLVKDKHLIDKVKMEKFLCEHCIEGKQTRLPLNTHKNMDHVTRPLSIVHSDVCGPINPPTINMQNYVLTFIDQYTHYCVGYLIKFKSDVFKCFVDFVRKSESHHNLKVSKLYCDNGGEYLSNAMKLFCSDNGIEYHLTAPHTPAQNGVAERMNRTIFEKVRTMMIQSKLDKKFWGDAVSTAIYLINRSPTRANMHETPYEKWHSKKPTLKFLKIFGSTAFVHNKLMSGKLDSKSIKGIFVGYDTSGYRVYIPSKDKYVTSKDVIFDEVRYLESRPDIGHHDTSKTHNSFVDAHSGSEMHCPTAGYSVKPPNIFQICEPIRSSSVECSDPESICDPIDNSCVEFPKSVSNELNKNSFVECSNSESIPADNISSCDDNLRRSNRLKEIKGIPHLNKIYSDFILYSNVNLPLIPLSFKELEGRDDKSKWELAVQDELNSLKLNNTWEIVTKPTDKNIVDCRWVFAIKFDEFGNPNKYKARLVAKGFSQQFLIDYNETFAPVARMTSFRFVIALANQFDLLVHHMDVKTAFLNGILKEEIFMRIPEGITYTGDKVCKLNKSIYGLKQSARCWFERFDGVLKEYGFINSQVDNCIYLLEGNSMNENIYLVLYVDDLIIVTGNQSKLDDLKHHLMKIFHMTDLKDITLFLGIKVTRTNNKITLDQSAYIRTILARFGMEDCNPVKTPSETKFNFEALNSDEPCNSPCRNLLGCLMYLMLCTRPDISSSVNIISRYINKNNEEVWRNLKRILRYLKGTINLKLTYTKSNYINILKGYVDSDWGGHDNTNPRSTSGYIFKLFDNNTISWSTKRQTIVALSSTEAEYSALCESGKEALWLKSLGQSIKLDFSNPIPIYEDNQSCISIAENPKLHSRTKHINMKYHFTRQLVDDNDIAIFYIPTGDQIADIFTKPLAAPQHEKLRDQLSLQ